MSKMGLHDQSVNFLVAPRDTLHPIQTQTPGGVDTGMWPASKGWSISSVGYSKEKADQGGFPGRRKARQQS